MNTSTGFSLSQKQALKNAPKTKMFWLAVLLLLPLWLCVLLPLTICYVIVMALLSALKLRASKQTTPPNFDTSSLEPCKVPKDNREFDVVVFGATGFTGNFMCSYLANNYELAVGKLSGTRQPKQVSKNLAQHLLFEPNRKATMGDRRQVLKEIGSS